MISSKCKILIVDDYRENIHALSHLIKDDDIEIYSALSGDEALSLLTLHDFSLALIDIQMPNMSGLELAKLIRGVNRFKHLPIIFVTAHPENQSILFQGYESGAVDMLFKPLNSVIVRSKVRVFVEASKKNKALQESLVELDKMRQEAEAENIAKSQFLANISHEIRTPLAAVMGFSEIMAHKKCDESEKEGLYKSIQKNGSMLMRLIDDILDFSKIEANQLEIAKGEISLGEVLKHVETSCSMLAQHKGIGLEFSGTLLPDVLHYGDANRIQQVLFNIIGNAVKFTTKGSVRVKFSFEPVEGAGARADLFRICVADDGIGISANHIGKLFKPFTQADLSTRKKFGGTGLGLAISRKICRAMGGDLRLVRSELGKGSEFEISFTLEKTVRRAAPERIVETMSMAEMLEGFRGKHILAVDDSADNLVLIQMFLQGAGAELICVESGHSAIAETKKNQFDLILMDLQMPDMDGHQTTRQLREMGYRQPIVALTAHAIQSERDKCYMSGCNDVLTKPFNQKALISKISQYFTAEVN